MTRLSKRLRYFTGDGANWAEVLAQAQGVVHFRASDEVDGQPRSCTLETFARRYPLTESAESWRSRTKGSSIPLPKRVLNFVRARQALHLSSQGETDLASVGDIVEAFDVTERHVQVLAEDLELNVNIGIMIQGAGHAHLEPEEYTLEDLAYYDELDKQGAGR